MHRPNEPEQVDASAAPQIQPSDHSPGYDGAREGKAWGRPFVAIDKFWTRFEVVLCTIVLLLEVFGSHIWWAQRIGHRPGRLPAGIVLRAIIGADRARQHRLRGDRSKSPSCATPRDLSGASRLRALPPG